MDTAPPGISSPLMPEKICNVKYVEYLTEYSDVAFVYFIKELWFVDINRHSSGPRCLHPLDIGGSNVGGVVVSRRQQTVQAGCDALGQDTCSTHSGD